MKPIAVPLMVLAGLVVTSGVAATEPSRPNIVVLLAAGMHRHHPGFNGGPVSTPNLDRLAREGTQLTQFYVHSVCSPTRGGLLNIHPKAPAGTTTVFVTPDESSGLVKRANYFKANPNDTVSTIQGKKCWTLSPHEENPKVSFLDIRVNYDQWRFGKIPNVKISLEYLDEGKGSIEVIYDSQDDTQKKLDTIMLSGSGTWKTWTGEVDDAMFACSIAQPYRNDDLVFVTRTIKPLSVARVSITRGTVKGPMTR